MPVYIRKNAPLSAPSAVTADFQEEDPDDYILDPEQFRDRLPQPFRMVDKAIEKLIDNAMEIILQREAERYKDASKIRPPQYQCAVHLEENASVGCMAATQDGQYIVIGMHDGLAAVDTKTHQTVCQWKEDGLEITNMNLSMFGEHYHMISTLDDFGTARVFCLAGNQFFLLHTFADPSNENSKVIAGKCEASSEGDYISVYFHNTLNQEGWLEVHKSPKDAWVKDLESLVAKVTAKREKAVAAAALAAALGTEGGTSTPPPTMDGVVEHQGPAVGVQDDASVRSQSPESNSPVPAKSTHKFSSPTLVLKVKSPQPVTGVNWSSPYQLSRTIDSSGDVVGLGTTHQVSLQHLEQRKAMFEQLHQQHMPYLPKDEQHSHVDVGFHFLLPGRMMPQGAEHATGAGQPTSIAVWWTGCPQLCHYSLLKQAIKDVEHKADVVWPLSSAVQTSCVSPDSTLMALALNNNNVLISNMHMGLPRRAVHIPSCQRIQSLAFLDPSLCEQPQPRGPYRQSAVGHLMVKCDQGEVYMVTTAPGDTSPPQLLPMDVEADGDTPTFIEPIKGIPQLMVTCRRNGKVFIHDILKAQEICEVILPSSHIVASPWQPSIAAASNGQVLFLKGEAKEVAKSPSSTSLQADDSPQDNPEGDQEEASPAAGAESAHCLFVFQLRSFPTLDKYREKVKEDVPYVVHPLVEDRLNALLKHRLLEQADRPGRMQERWNNLKNELDVLKRLDSHIGKQEHAPSVFQASSKH